MVRAAHPEELALESFIGLLEQGEDDSPRYPAETDPQVVPKAFGLEEVQKYIYRWGVAKIAAKDGESPDEGPAVGMQLGRVNVEFSK